MASTRFDTTGPAIPKRGRLRVEEPCPADVQFLEARLYDFNVARTGIDDGRGLGVFVRTHRGRIVAAVAGHSWGETCELRQVWVAEKLRGQGLGRQLLRSAEAEARRRGCRQIVLSTHSFQAPQFYRKLGFRVVAQVTDYPRGYAHVLLRKRLRPPRATRRAT